VTAAAVFNQSINCWRNKRLLLVAAVV